MNKLLFFSILLLTCVTGWANGIRNFYVDSFSDSQVADGSMESPFKSLDALKGVKFLPGDCIHTGREFHIFILSIVLPL